MASAPPPEPYREDPPPPDLAALLACTWSAAVPDAGTGGAVVAARGGGGGGTGGAVGAIAPAAVAAAAAGRGAGPAAEPVEARPGPVTRVLPDACVDVLWASGVGAFVAGPDTRAQLSRLAPGTIVRAIRARPGLGGVLVGLPAAELRDLRVAVGDLGSGVWDEGASPGRGGAPPVAPQDAPGHDAPPDAPPHGLPPGALGPDAPSGLAAAALLAGARRALAAAGRAGDDARLATGLVGLLGDPGARVRDVADVLGYGERQLRRRADATFGYGPKTLDRVLRLQRFLRLAEAAGSGRPLATVALAAGYADQAHLTRECTALAGLSPAALLAERAAF